MVGSFLKMSMGRDTSTKSIDDTMLWSHYTVSKKRQTGHSHHSIKGDGTGLKTFQPNHGRSRHQIGAAACVPQAGYAITELRDITDRQWTDMCSYKMRWIINCWWIAYITERTKPLIFKKINILQLYKNGLRIQTCGTIL